MPKALIIIASWEDRFVAGVDSAINDHSVDAIYCLASKRYLERTKQHRDYVAEQCAARRIQFKLETFDFYEPLAAFKVVADLCRGLAKSQTHDVLFDISTGPRNIIWSVLEGLSAFSEDVVIRYIRALSYGDWQTDNDLDPRILVHCSGVMYPDLPTCLVMMCGPEIARVEKMIYRFEPRRSIVLRDIEAAKYGKNKNVDLFTNGSTTEIEFDNKDLSEKNMLSLGQIIAPLVGDYNIVCSSFGPKLGAIALYKIHKKFEEVALAYVPAGTHNLKLSEGAQAVIEHRLKLK